MENEQILDFLYNLSRIDKKRIEEQDQELVHDDSVQRFYVQRDSKQELFICPYLDEPVLNSDIIYSSFEEEAEETDEI